MTDRNGNTTSVRDALVRAGQLRPTLQGEKADLEFQHQGTHFVVMVDEEDRGALLVIDQSRPYPDDDKALRALATATGLELMPTLEACNQTEDGVLFFTIPARVPTPPDGNPQQLKNLRNAKLMVMAVADSADQRESPEVMTLAEQARSAIQRMEEALGNP